MATRSAYRPAIPDAISRVQQALSPETRDPRFCYPSLGHQDALERLRHQTPPGTLLVVSGEQGVGKTLLLNVLLDAPGAETVPLLVRQPEAVRQDTRLLRSLIAATGRTARGRTGLDLTAELVDAVAEHGSSGRSTTLFLDNAHHLSGSQLELLRTLLATANDHVRLSAVAFGEPDVLDRIARRQTLADRVALRHVLNPLNLDDAEAMLDYRLRAAEIDPGIVLGDGVAALLAELGEGNPAAMLGLASRAFALAVSAGTVAIETSTILQTQSSERVPAPTTGETIMHIPIAARGEGALSE